MSAGCVTKVLSIRIGVEWDEIPKKELGVILTHEHLSSDFTALYVEPPKKLPQTNIDSSDITLANVGWVRQYPYSFKRNLILKKTDDKVLKRELQLFKDAGGRTIVENSCYGLNRDNEQIKKALHGIPKIQVVVGTGKGYTSPATIGMTAEKLSRLYMRDLEEFHGFIGAVGSNWPITPFEKKAIEATAIAQKSKKVAVSFYPGSSHEAPEEVIRLYTEAGGDPSRVAMLNLDTNMTQEQLLEFARHGTYCQFGRFGNEVSYNQLQPDVDMPSDTMRLRSIRAFIQENRLDKILISHSIHTKHRLASFGGHGFAHIPFNVQLLMDLKGFSASEIKKITETNPAEWLCGPN